MLKGVIFDMDGVIVNSEPLYIEVGKKIFLDLDLIISDEEYYSYIGSSLNNMWRDIKEKYQLKGIPVEQLCDLSIEQIINRLINEENLRLENGFSDLIQDLKSNSVKIALATSSPDEIVKIILDKLNINNIFDTVISGDMVTSSKPDPEIFRKAIKRLDLLPEECVVIEDSLNGILAAKRSGVFCIRYTKNCINNDGLLSADWMVDDFKKLNYKKMVQFIKNS